MNCLDCANDTGTGAARPAGGVLRGAGVCEGPASGLFRFVRTPNAADASAWLGGDCSERRGAAFSPW